MGEGSIRQDCSDRECFLIEAVGPPKRHGSLLAWKERKTREKDEKEKRERKGEDASG